MLMIERAYRSLLQKLLLEGRRESELLEYATQLMEIMGRLGSIVGVDSSLEPYTRVSKVLYCGSVDFLVMLANQMEGGEEVVDGDGSVNLDYDEILEYQGIGDDKNIFKDLANVEYLSWDEDLEKDSIGNDSALMNKWIDDKKLPALKDAVEKFPMMIKAIQKDDDFRKLFLAINYLKSAQIIRNDGVPLSFDSGRQTIPVQIKMYLNTVTAYQHVLEVIAGDDFYSYFKELCEKIKYTKPTDEEESFLLNYLFQLAYTWEQWVCGKYMSGFSLKDDLKGDKEKAYSKSFKKDKYSTKFLDELREVKIIDDNNAFIINVASDFEGTSKAKDNLSGILKKYNDLFINIIDEKNIKVFTTNNSEIKSALHYLDDNQSIQSLKNEHMIADFYNKKVSLINEEGLKNDTQKWYIYYGNAEDNAVFDDVIPDQDLFVAAYVKYHNIWTNLKDIVSLGSNKVDAVKELPVYQFCESVLNEPALKQLDDNKKKFKDEFNDFITGDIDKFDLKEFFNEFKPEIQFQMERGSNRTGENYRKNNDEIFKIYQKINEKFNHVIDSANNLDNLQSQEEKEEQKNELVHALNTHVFENNFKNLFLYINEVYKKSDIGGDLFGLFKTSSLGARTYNKKYTLAYFKLATRFKKFIDLYKKYMDIFYSGGTGDVQINNQSEESNNNTNAKPQEQKISEHIQKIVLQRFDALVAENNDFLNDVNQQQYREFLTNRKYTVNSPSVFGGDWSNIKKEATLNYVISNVLKKEFLESLKVNNDTTTQSPTEVKNANNQRSVEEKSNTDSQSASGQKIDAGKIEIPAQNILGYQLENQELVLEDLEPIKKDVNNIFNEIEKKINKSSGFENEIRTIFTNYGFDLIDKISEQSEDKNKTELISNNLTLTETFIRNSIRNKLIIKLIQETKNLNVKYYLKNLLKEQAADAVTPNTNVTAEEKVVQNQKASITKAGAIQLINELKTVIEGIQKYFNEKKVKDFISLDFYEYYQKGANQKTLKKIENRYKKIEDFINKIYIPTCFIYNYLIDKVNEKVASQGNTVTPSTQNNAGNNADQQNQATVMQTTTGANNQNQDKKEEPTSEQTAASAKRIKALEEMWNDNEDEHKKLTKYHLGLILLYELCSTDGINLISNKIYSGKNVDKNVLQSTLQPFKKIANSYFEFLNLNRVQEQDDLKDALTTYLTGRDTGVGKRLIGRINLCITDPGKKKNDPYGLINGLIQPIVSTIIYEKVADATNKVNLASMIAITEQIYGIYKKDGVVLTVDPVNNASEYNAKVKPEINKTLKAVTDAEWKNISNEIQKYMVKENKVSNGHLIFENGENEKSEVSKKKVLVFGDSQSVYFFKNIERVLGKEKFECDGEFRPGFTVQKVLNTIKDGDINILAKDYDFIFIQLGCNGIGKNALGVVNELISFINEKFTKKGVKLPTIIWSGSYPLCMNDEHNNSKKKQTIYVYASNDRSISKDNLWRRFDNFTKRKKIINKTISEGCDEFDNVTFVSPFDLEPFKSFQVDENGYGNGGRTFTKDGLHISDKFMYEYVLNLCAYLKNQIK